MVQCMRCGRIFETCDCCGGDTQYTICWDCLAQIDDHDTLQEEYSCQPSGAGGSRPQKGASHGNTT
jgi:hypothetical protein